MPTASAQIEIGFDGKPVGREDFSSDIEQVSKNPTVILARKLTIAVGLAAGWSYESQNEEVTDCIRECFEPYESSLIRSGILAALQYGWKPYEVVYELVDNAYKITKIKGLRHQNTDIILDRKTGDFKAFVLTDPNTSEETRIEFPQAAFVNFDETMEGRIGEPLLLPAIDPHKWWRDTNLTANRYDRKLAGGFIIIYYPVGSTMFNGVETPNDQIADAFLTAMQSSGNAKIPRYVSDTIDEMNAGTQEERWKIEIIQASGEQGNFVNRLKYLDSVILRCLGWTERSVTEGQFGTKAEAGEHADMALLNMHTLFKHFVSEINEQMVKPFLEYNYGDTKRGHIVPNELSDSKKQLFRSLLTELMTNPTIGLEIAESIDHMSVLDILGIPYNSEENDDRPPNPAGIPGVAEPSVGNAAGVQD